MGGVRQHLLKELQTEAGPYMFLGSETQGTYTPRITHLSCFLPGLLALGVLPPPTCARSRTLHPPSICRPVHSPGPPCACPCV